MTRALRQQTAAAEVLRVISSSPSELEPVFQTMLGNAVRTLRNATRLCQAKQIELVKNFAAQVKGKLMGKTAWSKRSRESGRFMDVKKSKKSLRACAERIRRVPGKRVQIDEETWHALEVLRRDKMATFQELMDQAISDFLKKHHRLVALKEALKESAGETGEPKRGRHRGRN